MYHTLTLLMDGVILPPQSTPYQTQFYQAVYLTYQRQIKV